jgi:hypothetical protein
MTPNNTWDSSKRLGGLRRFAVAITILNLLGHTFFGFEQSPAQPFVALATAYGMELLLEVVGAWGQRRKVAWAGGGLSGFVDFLLPAHITALACAMLLYANARLLPVAFATAVAIGSKAILRAPAGKGTRHFFNPSNFGITVTLLVFPWVGIAPPYHFTENLDLLGDLLLPAAVIVSGSILNARFTGKLPLIAGWLGGFVAQAVVRELLFGNPVAASLLPMTGMAFILYTFYMVTDPATTPVAKWPQFAFGLGVAVTYGLLLVMNVVFGLFFALTLVCAVRGLGLYARASASRQERVRMVAAQTPVVADEA